MLLLVDVVVGLLRFFLFVSTSRSSFDGTRGGRDSSPAAHAGCVCTQSAVLPSEGAALFFFSARTPPPPRTRTCLVSAVKTEAFFLTSVCGGGKGGVRTLQLTDV